MAAKTYEYVPSAVVEKAALHDLIYAACPRCFASLKSQKAKLLTSDESIRCGSCASMHDLQALQYKYRLKLQVIYDNNVEDAVLFDEVATTLLGVPPTELQKLLEQYSLLPLLLEELLVGLRVSFHYQKPEHRLANSTKTKYNKDLKIVAIAPLSKILLPKPLVPLAMDLLAR